MAHKLSKCYPYKPQLVTAKYNREVVRMIPYNELITDELKGSTPKERYHNLMEMKRILRQIVCPKKGTAEERYDLQDFADDIQQSLGKGFFGVNQ